MAHMHENDRVPIEKDLAARVDQASRGLELADPDAGLPVIPRIINRIVEVVGVALLTSILLITFANAFGRYALNYSLVWAEEVVVALIPWLAVAGLFLSVRRRQMVRIEYFMTGLTPSTRATINAFGQVLCAAVLMYLAWVALQYVQIFGADRSPYLGLPKGLASSAFVVGGILAASAFLASLLHELRTMRGR